MQEATNKQKMQQPKKEKWSCPDTTETTTNNPTKTKVEKKRQLNFFAVIAKSKRR